MVSAKFLENLCASLPYANGHVEERDTTDTLNTVHVIS